VVINGQRATGRGHGEATAAIGLGGLCEEFEAPGKGPPREDCSGGFLVASITCCEHYPELRRCGDGATANRSRPRSEGSFRCSLY
jgi:hypothetical protein